MASPPAETGGFRPGMRTYLIVGGAALVLGYLYLRSKGGTTPAAAPSAPATSSTTPTGVSTENIRLWIQDHQSGPKPKPKKKT